MHNWKTLVRDLSDDALLAETRTCASNEREKTAWLVAHLAEVYDRDLALKRGFPSLRDYARHELGLSDKQAWERVNAARLALQMPEVIAELSSGKLTPCAASVLWSTLKQAEKPAEAPKPLPLAIPMPAPARWDLDRALALPERRRAHGLGQDPGPSLAQARHPRSPRRLRVAQAARPREARSRSQGSAHRSQASETKG